MISQNISLDSLVFKKRALAGLTRRNKICAKCVGRVWWKALLATSCIHKYINMQCMCCGVRITMYFDFFGGLTARHNIHNFVT